MRLTIQFEVEELTAKMLTEMWLTDRIDQEAVEQALIGLMLKRCEHGDCPPQWHVILEEVSGIAHQFYEDNPVTGQYVEGSLPLPLD